MIAAYASLNREAIDDFICSQYVTHPLRRNAKSKELARMTVKHSIATGISIAVVLVLLYCVLIEGSGLKEHRSGYMERQGPRRSLRKSTSIEMSNDSLT